jgi:hypothetical protein
VQGVRRNETYDQEAPKDGTNDEQHDEQHGRHARPRSIQLVSSRRLPVRVRTRMASWATPTRACLAKLRKMHREPSQKSGCRINLVARQHETCE